ncbi:MAG: hypothetical protein V8T87_16220 [Victivallales bacterium]
MNIITRNPLNYQVVDEVRFIVGKDVIHIVVPEAQVEAAIEKFYPVDVTATMHDMLAELNLDAEIKDDENPEQSADQLEAQANEAPIIKFVDAIMYQAIKDKASDIHFEPFEKKFQSGAVSTVRSMRWRLLPKTLLFRSSAASRS